MITNLSNRVQQIQPSITFALKAKASELVGQGQDIINLSLGEPDFDTPEHIKQAAIKAINDGVVKYTNADGIFELKQAVIDKFKSENLLGYELNQVIVSAGAKQCLYNLMQAIINPGDEVIIPAPYWVSYPDMVKLAQGTPVIVESSLKQGFKISPEQLEKAITLNAKLLMLNSPSNPSGAIYSISELKALGEVLERHPQVLIASDDIYEHIRWSNEPYANIVNACPALYDRTIVINGVSKAYAMTGWRIGYAAGPTEIIAAMKKIQTQSTSCATSIAQVAAKTALQSEQTCVSDMVKVFQERHDFVVKELNSIDGITCLASYGTFYCFPTIMNLMKKLNIETDLEFCDYLLNHIGVVLVPGSAFGMPGHVRLSYATSIQELDQAIDRIKKIC